MPDEFSKFEALSDPSAVRRREPYLRSTALEWLQRAALLPGRALHLAIAIKYASDVAGGGTVLLRKKVVERFGLDRYAERRALAALEHAGLVRVQRAQGKRPRVALVMRPQSAEPEGEYLG